MKVAKKRATALPVRTVLRRGVLFVDVRQCCDLPVADWQGGSSDPYVVLKVWCQGARKRKRKAALCSGDCMALVHPDVNPLLASPAPACTCEHLQALPRHIYRYA